MELTTFVRSMIERAFNLAPPQVSQVPPGTRERKKYWAKNARALATFMETHEIKHEQANWGTGTPKYPCATAACALGTAAVYGLVPGLQYTYSKEAFMAGAVNPDDKREWSIFPVVDGVPSNTMLGWDAAGEKFFGPRIHEEVFCNTELSKTAVIRTLRDWAKVYEQEASN